VFYGGMDATAGPMVKQAAELGISKVKFAFGDGACTDEMDKLTGAAAEGDSLSQAGIPTQASGEGVPRRLQGEIWRREAICAVHL
jgi:branched-chain amino acid transport system substrate-binding protein